MRAPDNIEMEYNLEIVRKIKGLYLHAVTGATLWASSGYSLYKGEDGGRSWERIGRLPRRRFPSICEHSNLLQRLLRIRIRSVVPIGEDILLVIGENRIYRFLVNERKFRQVRQIRRGHPLVHGLCLDAQNHIYCGEYWLNPEREAVHIYKSGDEGQSWKIIHTFPRGTVRHIHAVQHDPLSGLIWVCTGDKNSESQIGYSADGGRTFISIGGGSQQWRTTRLVFTEKYIYWGTDAPDEQNYIYRWRRSTGPPERLIAVEGPVHCAAGLSDGTILMATGCEKGWGRWDPVRIAERMLRVPDQEAGTGERDSYAHIWASPDGEKWFHLARWGKDWLPSRLFGSGTIHFAGGADEGDYFYFSTSALKHAGSCTFRARIEKK